MSLISFKQKFLPAIFVSLLAVVLIGPLASGQDLFTCAVMAMKQKRFNEAGIAFEQVVRAQPQNVDAYVYWANCHFMMGDLENAMKAYWFVVRKFSSHRKAIEVREFLKKTDKQYALHAGDANYYAFLDMKELPKSSAGHSHSTSTTSRSSTSGSASTSIDELIQIVPPLKNRPAVSASLIDRTKSALREYPPELLALIKRRNCKVWLTPTMIDKEPGLQNTQPSGYMEGHTYKDCPGMFSRGQIIVCEYTIGNGFDWEHTDDPIGTLRHELGHAVDRFLNSVSDTEEYKHAYLLDVGQIRDDYVRNKISYYLQKDDRGPAETFAELMCAKYGGRTANYYITSNELVAQHFPLTKAVINKKIAELSAK